MAPVCSTKSDQQHQNRKTSRQTLQTPSKSSATRVLSMLRDAGVASTLAALPSYKTRPTCDDGSAARRVSTAQSSPRHASETNDSTVHYFRQHVVHLPPPLTKLAANDPPLSCAKEGCRVDRQVQETLDGCISRRKKSILALPAAHPVGLPAPPPPLIQ